MTNPVARWEDYFQRVHPEWRYHTLDANTLVVEVPHFNEELHVTCSVEQDGDGDHDWYGADYPFPLATPEDRHAAIGELLHRINGKFPGCAFCLDYDSGQVTCTSMHPCSGSDPDDIWLDKVVMPLLDAIIRFRTGLIATSFYDDVPRLAIPLRAMDLPLIPPSDSSDVWWV